MEIDKKDEGCGAELRNITFPAQDYLLNEKSEYLSRSTLINKHLLCL